MISGALNLSDLRPTEGQRLRSTRPAFESCPEGTLARDSAVGRQRIAAEISRLREWTGAGGIAWHGTEAG
jgi:hypothetical protein